MADPAELGVRPEYRVRFQGDADDFLPGEAAYLIACCQARLGRRADAIDALATAPRLPRPRPGPDGRLLAGLARRRAAARPARHRRDRGPVPG